MSAPRFFPLPDVGDIVWCRFPLEGFASPGPRARPGLVVNVGDLRGEPAVEIIYGTSQKLDRLYPGEFAITREDAGAFAHSGLSYPTKFDTSRAVFLPYNEQWFAIAPGAPHGQTPQLGVLHPSLLPRVKAAVRAARRDVKRE